MTFTECQKGGEIMKKFVAIILCVVFVGCAVVEDSPKKETANASSQAEKTETTFGLNESAVFRTLKFTATEIKESNGEDFFEPDDGNVFVGVKFEIENISDEEQSISTLLLFEGYADDVKCEYSFNAACAFSEGTLDGTIAPGKRLKGWYALEVPEDWEELELDVQSDWLSNKQAKFVFKK